MIEVNNLIYEYPGKRALKDVSFKINKGSITALVGPNGAGKTTLMRCIAALDEPFSGEVFVSEIDALLHPRSVHQKIGYLSDFFGVYRDLTVRRCLTFAASIYQIEPNEIDIKVKQAAENLNLLEYLDVEAGTLSRGLRQRLGIAQAIIHQPDVLLLDEPAAGLDPEARISLSKLFKKLQQQGMTLLVSSHILAELEDYCTEMLLLRDGKIVDHLAGKKGENEKQINKIVISLFEQDEKYLNKIAKIKDIENVNQVKDKIEFDYPGDKKAISLLMKKLIDSKIPLYSFMVKEKRLQDIYMDYAKGDSNDNK